jgi:hypothetical protein
MFFCGAKGIIFFWVFHIGSPEFLTKSLYLINILVIVEPVTVSQALFAAFSNSFMRDLSEPMTNDQ